MHQDRRLPAGRGTRLVDAAGIAGAGDETGKLFAADTRSKDSDVHYRVLVVPGRYRVTLYFAESSGDAVDGLGRGRRLISVSLNDEKVLCNWSAAAAAGSPSPSRAVRITWRPRCCSASRAASLRCV